MNAKWQRLAGSILLTAAQHMGESGCNDWKWPDDWTLEERLELARAMVADNVRKIRTKPSDEDEDQSQRLARDGPPDWWVAIYLGEALGYAVDNPGDIG